jgi:hypothetical protein
MGSNNDYDVRVALGPYKQSAYGTRLVDGSMTLAYPTKDASPAERTPELRDDSGEFGKGHEYPTRQDLEYWDTKKSLSFDLDSFMAALWFAFGLGDCSSAVDPANGSVTFTGAGLNDMTVSGTPNADIDFKVQIDGNGTPDTFKWSNDGGETWDAETVGITGSAQVLSNGVSVTFAATIGHTITNNWAWTTGAAFKHTCKMSDPDTVSNQNPFMTLVEDRSGIKRYYPDLCVADLELSGKIKERPSLKVNLAGSGRIEDAASFSMPELSAADFLRWSGLAFQLGPSGALVVESARLRDFSFKVNNNLLLAEGYAANCGLYRSRCQFGSKRTVELSFTLIRSDTTELEAYEGQTELKAVFTFTGSAINGSSKHHALTLTFQKLLYKSAVVGYENGREVVKCTATLLYYAADGGPVKAEITNETPEFLASEA